MFFFFSLLEPRPALVRLKPWTKQERTLNGSSLMRTSVIQNAPVYCSPKVAATNRISDANECGFVLKSVPAADARHTMDEMQLVGEVASEECPHCGSVNLFPGFSRMFVFTCRECGKGVGLTGLTSSLVMSRKS